MRDINGQELRQGGAGLLLCEILEIAPDFVRVRIANSELELAVGAKNDEALGGLVADSELTAFLEEPEPARAPAKASRFDDEENSIRPEIPA